MKSVKAIAGAVLTLLAASTVSASPILVAGSTYDVYLAGEVSGNPSDLTVTADGVAEAYTRGGLNLLLNETETDLGSGNHLISILLTADGDLFPTPGEGAIVGVGVTNGLNFLAPLHLTDARITYFIGSTPFFTTSNLADDYRAAYFSDPWSGSFAALNTTFINPGAGGNGFDGVQFDFTVAELSQVPEPATLTLIGLGLSGLAVRRRRSNPVKDTTTPA